MTQTSGLEGALNRKRRGRIASQGRSYGRRIMNRLHRWICRSGFWKKFLQNEILPWALTGLDLEQNLLEVGPGPFCARYTG